jgi:hypothetical protein
VLVPRDDDPLDLLRWIIVVSDEALAARVLVEAIDLPGNVVVTRC